MCNYSETRLVIFMSDFQLDFSVPVDTALRQLDDMMLYVESRGNALTIAFLPYVPAYSHDPNVRPTFLPFPDHTDYLVKIKDKLKIFGSNNALPSCFSNKRVGMNAKRNNYKGQDWQGFTSMTDPN